MDEFANKTAVITGAASGIGFALAEQCTRRGMKVVLADVEEAALDQAAQRLRSGDAQVRTVRTDVSKAADVERLAQTALQAFGAVHLLFNNAGVGIRRPLWEFSLDDWQWILGVNLWGVVHGIHIFVPIMLAQDTECHIVNTASALGLVTGPTHGAYKVSKHAIVALSEILSHELSQLDAKIHVSLLCPGSVNTRITQCERNRPKELGCSGPVDLLTRVEQDFERFCLEAGMAPGEVAERVFEAIQQRKFYVLTHPAWKPAVQARMEDILQERNPTLPDPFPPPLG
jgi:NAD(P)-dependent dehydrogenase (short-subunit alcohol dehydrogenase family)